MTTKNLLSEGDSWAWLPGNEEFLEGKGGAQIFSRSANPTGAPRAAVIITHGLGEHSNRYGHVAAAFVERGCRVAAWDLRGHGRSSGMRGDLEDYGCLMEDLHIVCARYRVAERPIFLFGHSLGGQITLRFLQSSSSSFQGAIIASPWLRLAFDPPWWKLLLARAAMRFWPQFMQSTGNLAERLSRDALHLQSFPDIDLMHHGISARMYFAVRAGAAQALSDAENLRTPLLLLHGDADPVTSHHSTCQFFEKVGSADKTLRIIPGARHETHNDLDRVQVIREMADWLAARLSAGPA